MGMGMENGFSYVKLNLFLLNRSQFVEFVRKPEILRMRCNVTKRTSLLFVKLTNRMTGWL